MERASLRAGTLVLCSAFPREQYIRMTKSDPRNQRLMTAYAFFM